MKLEVCYLEKYEEIIKKMKHANISDYYIISTRNRPLQELKHVSVIP